MSNFNRKNLAKYLLLPLALVGSKIDASENIEKNTQTFNVEELGNNKENTKLSDSENIKFSKKFLKKLMTKYLPSYLVLMNSLDTEDIPSENKIKSEYRNFNEKLFNNLKKIKCLGKGMQGKVFLYKNTITHKKYVLKKTTKENLSCPRNIYEEFPEFLACEKLTNFECDYIVKPLAYRQTSDYSAEILLEYAENNVSLKSLTLQERKEILKQILSAREQLQKVGLIHGDICRKNFNIEKKKDGHITIHIYDYGYSSKIKDSYSERDTIMYMHPFIDIQQIYKSIKCIFNTKLVEVLNKKTEKELPNLYKLISKDTWKIRNRKKYASEISKISLDDCNRFIDIVEKWANEIKS